jgi:hypothetical protein
MMADVSQWVQLSGTALGGVLSLAGGLIAQLMTTGREREGRRVEAEEHRKRQRADFQVKTLLEVQEAAWQVLDAGRWFAVHALKRTDAAGQAGGARVPADVLTQWEKAVPRQIVLTTRVEDARLRELLTTLRGEANDALRLSSNNLPKPAATDCHAANEQLLATFQAANDRIGEILRDLT